MSLAATFTAPQCSVSVVAASKSKGRKNAKRAGVSTRAQKPSKSEEVTSIVFPPPAALSNSSAPAPVIEETEVKAPSPSIHIISPVSQ